MTLFTSARLSSLLALALSLLTINSFAATNTYGPVQSSDTLWSIAKQNRPSEDVSLYQVVWGLYVYNPKSFSKGNIHGLMAGSHLNIPSPEQLAAISSERAMTNIHNQAPLPVATNDLPHASTSAATASTSQTPSHDQLATPNKASRNQTLPHTATPPNNDFSSLQNELTHSKEALQQLLDEDAKLSEKLAELEAELSTLLNDAQALEAQQLAMQATVEF